MLVNIEVVRIEKKNKKNRSFKSNTVTSYGKNKLYKCTQVSQVTYCCWLATLYLTPIHCYSNNVVRQVYDFIYWEDSFYFWVCVNVVVRYSQSFDYVKKIIPSNIHI